MGAARIAAGSTDESPAATIDKARARHERLGRAAGALTPGKPGVVSTGGGGKWPTASTAFKHSLCP